MINNYTKDELEVLQSRLADAIEALAEAERLISQIAELNNQVNEAERLLNMATCVRDNTWYKDYNKWKVQYSK